MLKRIFTIILCTFFLFIVGCDKTTNVEVKQDTVSVDENDKDKIRDNYLESIEKKFPHDFYISGLNLTSKNHYAQFGVNYQGNKEKTMSKMKEILKVSEDFFKTQEVEYVYFETMDDQMNVKGKFTLHLENNKYVVKESTLE